MANSAPVLMWMTTADKMSNWFNQPWLEFVGRTIEQEQGLGWAENIHPEDRDRALAECGAAFQARREFRMEFRLRRRDGAYRWILDHGVPYQDERGEFSGYIGSCIDITELREAQHQLEQANATKDRFLAVLSHELRTPLTPVLFAVEALKQHPGLTSRGGQLLAMIERNIRLEARLIDDLLDLTRIIRNRMEFASEPLDLHECLNAAVEVCRSSMESRGLRLIVRLEASPAAIRGDFQRLEQVFWNLLQNAEKFTPPGGAVEVRTQRDQEKIRIEVSDTGCGIQPEALQNIFAPFEQAGKTSGGLGLGLAICKATVEAHGGSIWAVSDGPGRGARFCVELQTPPASAPR
jgi:PAS domain S-box-containing protein